MARNPYLCVKGRGGAYVKSFDNVAAVTIGTFKSQVLGKPVRMAPLKHSAPTFGGLLTALNSVLPRGGILCFDLKLERACS